MNGHGLNQINALKPAGSRRTRHERSFILLLLGLGDQKGVSYDIIITLFVRVFSITAMFDQFNKLQSG